MLLLLLLLLLHVVGCFLLHFLVVRDCTSIAIDLRLWRTSADGARGSALGSAKAVIACTCMCFQLAFSLLAPPYSLPPI